MKDNMDKKIVIFDLDGTLALIDDRRALSTDVGTGKMDWDIFFDPQNIFLDKPNTPVIKMSQMLRDQGFRIAIV
jgi:FMN phosphatase YigB (HAD superfamily)